VVRHIAQESRIDRKNSQEGVQPGIDSDFLGLPSMTAWSIGAHHANVMAGLAQCCIFPFNPQSVIESELVPRLPLRAFCPIGGRDIASPCPSPTPIASGAPSSTWSAISARAGDRYHLTQSHRGRAPHILCLSSRQTHSQFYGVGRKVNQPADEPSEDVSDSAEDMDGCEDAEARVLIPGS
jgi:hypothetical protein